MMNKKLLKITKVPLYGNMTEEEQFEKALKKCRNCKHIKMAHSFLGMFKKIGKCIDATLSKTGKYIACKCKGWSSSDNLEYMEEIYEKKNRRR